LVGLEENGRCNLKKKWLAVSAIKKQEKT